MGADLCERATRELKRPWNSRIRMDKAVCGAVELAFLRGYQAGFEDARARKQAKYFVNEPARKK